MTTRELLTNQDYPCRDDARARRSPSTSQNTADEGRPCTVQTVRRDQEAEFRV